MGIERRFRSSGRLLEGTPESPHQIGNLQRIGKNHRRAGYPPRMRAVDAADSRLAARDNTAMQFTDDILANGGRPLRQFAHPEHRIVVIESFQVILERLAAHSDAVLDDLGGLAMSERVPLKRVGGIGQLDVVILLQLPERGMRHRPELVELGLLGEDRGQKRFHAEA